MYGGYGVMKLAQKVVIEWDFELLPSGEYLINLYFDTGEVEKFPIEKGSVMQSKIRF